MSSRKVRTRCFFDVQIGEKPAGRVTFELYDDVCPLTAENVRALCTGEMGLGKVTQKPLHYKGCGFHRVIKNFMIQSGDFSMGNGRGGESIYGGTFKDENFELKHDKPYILSMANRGKDTNGSQHYITTKNAPHLDGVHVVFGHVISGQEVVDAIENVPTDKNSKPIEDVVISNCGELIPQIKPKEKKEKEKDAKSEDGGHKKSKHKKKHKKHKKHEKKDKEERKKPEKETVEECSVKPEEIPEIPENKFLMRGMAKEETDSGRKRNVEESSVKPRTYISRSGRKIKGRGFRRYRTPSPGARSGSETPPHWRYAQSRIKLLNSVLNEKDRNERKRDDHRNYGRTDNQHDDRSSTYNRPDRYSGREYFRDRFRERERDHEQDDWRRDRVRERTREDKSADESIDKKEHPRRFTEEPKIRSRSRSRSRSRNRNRERSSEANHRNERDSSKNLEVENRENLKAEEVNKKIDLPKTADAVVSYPIVTQEKHEDKVKIDNKEDKSRVVAGKEKSKKESSERSTTKNSDVVAVNRSERKPEDSAEISKQKSSGSSKTSKSTELKDAVHRNTEKMNKVSRSKHQYSSSGSSGSSSSSSSSSSSNSSSSSFSSDSEDEPKKRRKR